MCPLLNHRRSECCAPMRAMKSVCLCLSVCLCAYHFPDDRGHQPNTHPFAQPLLREQRLIVVCGFSHALCERLQTPQCCRFSSGPTLTNRMRNGIPPFLSIRVHLPMRGRAIKRRTSTKTKTMTMRLNTDNDCQVTLFISSSMMEGH